MNIHFVFHPFPY